MLGRPSTTRCKFAHGFYPPYELLTIFGDHVACRATVALCSGGTYFFIVNLADRSATTLVDKIDLLRSVYASVVREHPIHCDAMLILPNHIHAAWTLPSDDADFLVRWKKIKGWFSQHCKATGTPSPSKMARGEKGIWQRRFWEHAIRDEIDFQRHVEYCWWNPMKHGLVTAPEDWEY